MWIKDANGNKCSTEVWGSREAAQRALDSLQNCKNCTNCSRCSGCSYCSRCSRCSGCSYCSRCSGCSDCSYCSRCSRCSGCSDSSGAVSLENQKNLQAYPDVDAKPLGPPPVPKIENIHQAVYAAASAPYALEMSNWHTCEKTHCRAGWVIALAGKAGLDLEEFFDTPLAAMKIYAASDPGFQIHPGRFFDDNESALADMKRMAES